MIKDKRVKKGFERCSNMKYHNLDLGKDKIEYRSRKKFSCNKITHSNSCSLPASLFYYSDMLCCFYCNKCK